MTLTPAARALASSLIIAMEGLRLAAYQDGDGVWTIGIGSTVMPSGGRVQRGNAVTHAQALALLDIQIDEWAASLSKSITVNLSDNWTAALVSFVHQEGVNALVGSVLADMLNAKLWDRAAAQLNGWVIARVNGVRQPVLGIERRMEVQRQIALGAPLEPTRTMVWAQGDATLRPLYAPACADAAAYRSGNVTWEVVPVSVPTHPSTATSQRQIGPVTKPVAQASTAQSSGPTTDNLNDASAAGALDLTETESEGA